MSWVIAVDSETGVACLVDPDGPWALGPCLRGPAARDVLGAYVDGLGQDPTELTTWELSTTWQQFVALMGQDVEQAATAPPAGAGEPPTGSGDPLDHLPETASQEGAGEGTAVLEAGRDEPPPPVTRETWPPCPNCRSNRREAKPDGSVACAVCGQPLEAVAA